jgi:hypothetical protein
MTTITNTLTQKSLDELAPVAVYTYSRVEHFIKTVDALKNNFLAKHTVLYIISDGPKCQDHLKSVEAIRNYSENLSGFREVVKIFRPSNLGAAQSPLLADNQILHDHRKIIKMEDDNITSQNFLDFMNGGLEHFEEDESIYSICGYCPPVGLSGSSTQGDFWRYPWNISWGYAIWKSKNDRLYPLNNRFPEMRRSGLLTRQNRSGGLYVTDSLKRDYFGFKYFPDAILCSEMFQANMHAILPTISKVHNLGQDGSGQSSQQITNKYDVELDSSMQRTFDFTHASMHSDIYLARARGFYNGGLVTRCARALGVYHQLAEWRERLVTKMI